jgi:integrase
VVVDFSGGDSVLVGWYPATRSSRVRGLPEANRLAVYGWLDIKKGFRSACDDANIRDLRFHDLRHTFRTRLADSGASTRTIMDLMGHSQIATSARYTHATDHGKRRAVDALARYAETIATELRQKRKEPEPLRLASA